MNLALASSSILFYQVVRILLTPTTVVINLFFYNSKLPTNAILALLPACVGVVLVIYSDALSHSSKDQNQPPTMAATSDLGIIFSIAGLLCSSLYTVWIAHHVSRLQLSSVQLLFNQVPCCAALLSLLSVFTDTFPIWRDLTSQQWCLLLLSGGCACMIHLSTFIIIKAAGPVASTVVALIKTCLIVGLGWLENPGKMGWESVLGIILALSGIICYSFAMHPYGAR
jgi:solute carrier family 35 protein E3